MAHILFYWITDLVSWLLLFLLIDPTSPPPSCCPHLGLFYPTISAVFSLLDPPTFFPNKTECVRGSLTF